jgi:hypothetical protein
VEAGTGLISAYHADLATTISANTGTASRQSSHSDMVARIGAAVWHGFPVLIAAAVTAAAYGILNLTSIWRRVRYVLRRPIKGLRSVAASRVTLLSFLVVGALLNESQNSGSQPYVYLVPALLAILPGSDDRKGRLLRILVIATVGIFVSQIATRYYDLYRGFRAGSVAVSDTRFAQFVAASRDMELAEHWLTAYAGSIPTASDRLGIGPMRSGGHFMDFHLSFVRLYEQGAQALLAWARQAKVQINSVATLDFVDPMPLLTGTAPLPGLPTYRALDRLQTETYMVGLDEAFSRADVILEPVCPDIAHRRRMREALVLTFRGRKRVELLPCWIMWLKADVAP